VHLCKNFTKGKYLALAHQLLLHSKVLLLCSRVLGCLLRCRNASSPHASQLSMVPLRDGTHIKGAEAAQEPRIDSLFHTETGLRQVPAHFHKCSPVACRCTSARRLQDNIHYKTSQHQAFFSSQKR
jgi:hypothetical protein